jgi:hypothetical protein
MSTVEGKELALVADELTPAEYAHYEEYGPYGHWGNSVGHSAILVLEQLLEPKVEARLPGSEPVMWERSDKSALVRLKDLDWSIELIEPAPDPVVDGHDIRELFKTFGRLHAALPFSEAERAWLLAKDEQNWSEGLIGEAAEIMSAGVRRVVQGRDLVRRWWAWRRDTDEFAGQGGLDEARQALGIIADTLVIEAQWPRNYPDIRARLQEL